LFRESVLIAYFEYGKQKQRNTKLKRAMALLNIAHPIHRGWLEKEVIKRFGK